MEQKTFDNTNRGRLFKNDRKTEERQPDLTGDINISGVDYFLSAWKKTSKTGKNYLSISIGNKKEVQPSQQPQQVQQVQQVQQHVQSVQTEQEMIDPTEIPF